MVGFNLHVHATREELTDKALSWIGSYGISAFVLYQGPFRSCLLEPSMRNNIINNDGSAFSLMFTMCDPVFPVESQFPEQYADRLHLFLPVQTDKSLEQITFGLKIFKDKEFDEKSLSMWKILASDMRKSTKAGLCLYYPSANETSKPFRSFRFSEGAAQAYREGVTLLLPNKDAVGKLP